MLRYEEIIKEFLENNQCKIIGIQDDRILIEINGDQKIFRAELAEDRIIIIKNVYSEIEYTIKLK